MTTTATGYLLRCAAGHETEASTRLATCPHGGCGRPLDRIKADGSRHPRQA